MSTRATYQFKTEHGTHTFYIHHDGYPAGAAMYFNNALNFRGGAPNSTIADRFYRANDRSELTRNHESHGDTDYRYTVARCDGIFSVKVHHREFDSHGNDKWHLIACKPLANFIAENDQMLGAA